MAVTESSAMWVPETMAQLDQLWATQRAMAQGRAILFRDDAMCERTPSEYWTSNGFVGASLLSFTEMQHRHDIGITTMMYGNDYPHPEGSWGKQTSWLQASIGRAGGTEEETRMILGLNAARLYDLDVGQLQPIANQVGPEIGDVLHVLTDDEVDALLAEAATSGRVLTAGHFSGMGARAG
jgi:hypothetical protein